MEERIHSEIPCTYKPVEVEKLKSLFSCSLSVCVCFFFWVLTVNVSHKQFTLEELPAEKYHSSSLLNISHSELESLLCIILSSRCVSGWLSRCY